MKPRKKLRYNARRAEFASAGAFNWEQVEAAIFNDLKRAFGVKNVQIISMGEDSVEFEIN